jgi:hypothetical protein
MENPSEFDLNGTLARWRQDWASASALGAEDRRELEAHLRDSMARLQGAGLSPQEAFLVASRRLGTRRELEREFGKVNEKRIWVDRAVWMVAGLLGFNVLAWMMTLSSSLIGPLNSPNLNAHVIVGLVFLTRWILCAAALTVVWHFVTRRPAWFARLVQLCLRRPLLPILGLIWFNYSMLPLYRWLVDIISSPPSPEAIRHLHEMAPIFNGWAMWNFFVTIVVLMAALCQLARRGWKDAEPVQPGWEAGGLEELTGPAKEQAQALVGRGLAPAEAAFLVRWRQQASRQSAEVPGSAGQRVWAQRAVWMLAGTLLCHYYFSDTLLVLARVFERGIASHWSVSGHIIGFCSVVFQWALIAAVVAGLWRWVARGGTWSGRLGHCLVERPFLGWVGLLLLYVGWWFLMVQVGRWIPETAASQTHTAEQWTLHGFGVLSHVIPVLLLFWLARRCWVEKAGGLKATGASGG